MTYVADQVDCVFSLVVYLVVLSRWAVASGKLNAAHSVSSVDSVKHALHAAHAVRSALVPAATHALLVRVI